MAVDTLGQLLAFCGVRKYITRSRLEDASISFDRMHDLLVLHQLVLSLEPGWGVLQRLGIYGCQNALDVVLGS